ncbi:hypothetical protein [Chryseobacterium proteolyticum]
MTVTIVNDGGVFLVNGKRLGHDPLTELEMVMLNEFIKEYKDGIN